MMRLDKLLAHSQYGTRKEVKELIRKGYVEVNGEVVRNDDFKVDEINDEIIVGGNNVNYQKTIYYLLHKPSGVVSATFDNRYQTVLDCIDDEQVRRCFPVGRLDIDTEGLLLITNDGKLAHFLLSPKFHVDKKYYVEFDGEFKEDYINDFKEGIVIDDGYKCLPALLEKISDNRAYITIHEGKFHQVKRMFEARNMKVTYLRRETFGPLSLDESLPLGSYRHLSEEETEKLKDFK